MAQSIGNSSIHITSSRRLVDNKKNSYNPKPRLTLKDVKIREVVSERHKKNHSPEEKQGDINSLKQNKSRFRKYSIGDDSSLPNDLIKEGVKANPVKTSNFKDSVHITHRKSVPKRQSR